MKHFSFSVSEVLFFILIFAITIPGNVIAEQDLSEGVGNFNQLSDEHKVKGQTLEDLSFQNSIEVNHLLQMIVKLTQKHIMPKQRVPKQRVRRRSVLLKYRNVVKNV